MRVLLIIILIPNIHFSILSQQKRGGKCEINSFSPSKDEGWFILQEWSPLSPPAESVSIFVIYFLHFYEFLSYEVLLWVKLCLTPKPRKKMCWSPNLQYLRTWPYLEIDINRGTQVKWSFEMGPNPMWPMNLLKGEIWAQRHARKKMMWRGTRWRQPSTGQGEGPGADPSCTAHLGVTLPASREV